jgi:SHS2 domain-containing protein
MERYKFLSHTADMKFQAFGKTMEECFSNAGYALREIITKDKIKPVIKKKIEVKGRDFENLLYNFLEEFIFLLDSENFILSKIIKIKIDNKKKELIAEIIGDNIHKYKTMTDVKAVTYNDMFIKNPSKDGNCLKKDKNKYICQVVVDV